MEINNEKELEILREPPPFFWKLHLLCKVVVMRAPFAATAVAVAGLLSSTSMPLCRKNADC